MRFEIPWTTVVRRWRWGRRWQNSLGLLSNFKLHGCPQIFNRSFNDGRHIQFDSRRVSGRYVKKTTYVELQKQICILHDCYQAEFRKYTPFFLALVHDWMAKFKCRSNDFWRFFSRMPLGLRQLANSFRSSGFVIRHHPRCLAVE